MKTWQVVPLMMAAGLLVGGCGGEAGLDPGAGGPASAGAMECYGDPDMGGVICKPVADLWDCNSMPNGDVKCRKTGFATPSGAGTWTCSAAGGKVVCTTPGANVPGGSGWTCTSDGKTTACTYDSSSVPPGSGSWTCTVTEFGLSCIGKPAGSGTGGTGTGTGTGGTGTGTGGTGGTGTGTGGSGTGGWSGFACSYAMFVFTYQGKTYVMKISGGAITCVGENSTSKDAHFSYGCNGVTYDNDGFVVSAGDRPVAPFPGNCPSMFAFTKSGVTAGAGITILFGVAHNGSFPNHFAELCPAAGGTTHIDFPPICGGN